MPALQVVHCCDGLPEMEEDDTDAGGDAGATDVDEDVDDDDALKRPKKIIFKPASSKRLRFCIQAKMSDSSIDINDKALVALLWGRRQFS
ncbi:hypothetical protein KI688_003181 [Linnemannia hyalina]|uniref:Uncharacterized protein n=1 Tax=Linnemannia hyalina TaxID=64524 RepID=A0A9P7XS16_9FUNG|nr:hypothetical protein KI688_003181 [Linnemannia hyalina]